MPKSGRGFSPPPASCYVSAVRALTAFVVLFLALGSEPAHADPDPGSAAPVAQPTPPDVPWCNDAVEKLTDSMCHFSPAKAGDAAPTKLVIFLHGVIKVGTDWQYNQHLALVRAAKANGFEVLLPRGRVGAGSKKFADHWNWPSSAEGQKVYEAEVIAEWMAAKQTLEERNGRPFEQVYVFGFSAGAYYASSLALRGRMQVDGYGVFAGGGAPKGVERWAKGVRPRPPVYVGWGGKDKARKDPQRFAKALKAMGWRHKAIGRRKVGHSVTDAQIKEAMAFLGKEQEKTLAKKTRES